MNEWELLKVRKQIYYSPVEDIFSGIKRIEKGNERRVWGKVSKRKKERGERSVLQKR